MTRMRFNVVIPLKEIYFIGKSMKKIFFIVAVLLMGYCVFGEASGSDRSSSIQMLNNSLSRLQRQVISDEVRLDSLRQCFRDSLKHLAMLLSDLRSQHALLPAQFAPARELDTLSLGLDKKIAALRRTVRIYCILLILFVLLASGVTFYVLQRLMQHQLEIEPLNEFQVFFNKIKGALNRQQKGASSEPATDVALPQQATQLIDHELPTRVAEEVFRMRMRLGRMPQETKGLTALQNAVNRLEDELNMKGYSLIDLSGQPYVDEMTVAVKEFIPQDDLPAGHRRILRMLKPQVKYMDTIISYGEAEVAMSADDLAQA